VPAAPLIQLDDTFVLEGWRSEDAPAQRAFAEDADAARLSLGNSTSPRRRSKAARQAAPQAGIPFS
jgi:hypothetical protein